MSNPAPLAELWRGDLLESLHTGHAVICDSSGQIVWACGNPDTIIYPRSSAKMIQALPLVESGAADAAGLGVPQLALSCASHSGEAQHTTRVADWIEGLGLSENDFRCGVQQPSHSETRRTLLLNGEAPCQLHNNCSGKHAGFLTLNRHLGAGAEYVEVDHPVQTACKTAFEEVTGMDSPCYGIDGCSAPNFATSVHGLARAMASFASAHTRSGVRAEAQSRLVQAMITHPELVAGTGRACTELMGAAAGRAALKTGAEAVFVGMIPETGFGIALKVVDGGTRGAECAIAALMVRLGILDANDPAVLKRMNAVQKNWRGIETGIIRPAAHLLS